MALSKLLSVFAFGVIAAGSAGASTFTIYSDRAAFEAELDGNQIVDGFDAAGYFVGDRGNTTTLDLHSDASMSAVLGEASFEATGFANNNIIDGQTTNPFYCAGCNGSFNVEFTSTSVGTASGVFGVGFDFFNSGSLLYTAFVTFGDGGTANIPLGGAVRASTAFFGITSDHLITSIHFGLVDGGSTGSGFFGIDDLTYGASDTSVIPLPATLPLLAGAVLVMGWASRRRA